MNNKKTMVSKNSLNNLKPFDKMDPEKRRAMASKGGIKSAEVQRERRKLKEELKLILEIGDNQKRMSVSLFNRTLGDDNVSNKAYEIIRDTIGEKEPEKIITENSPVDQLIKSIDNLKNK